jgi:hypothetical protein
MHVKYYFYQNLIIVNINTFVKIKKMEHKCSSNFSNDYNETICSMQCDVLLQENQSILNEYFEFCSTRLVLPVANFNKKQLHLFGSTASITEAGKIRKVHNSQAIVCFYFSSNRKTIS